MQIISIAIIVYISWLSFFTWFRIVFPFIIMRIAGAFVDIFAHLSHPFTQMTLFIAYMCILSMCTFIFIFFINHTLKFIHWMVTIDSYYIVFCVFILYSCINSFQSFFVFLLAI